MIIITRAYQRFCKAACRKAFHDAHNTSFGHVKHLFQKELRAHFKEFADLQRRVLQIEIRLGVMAGANYPFYQS